MGYLVENIKTVQKYNFFPVRNKLEYKWCIMMLLRGQNL